MEDGVLSCRNSLGIKDKIRAGLHENWGYTRLPSEESTLSGSTLENEKLGLSKIKRSPD